MAEPLFGSHCSLPSIARVDFDFVDCSLELAPEPIYDCPLIDLPIEPPPEQLTVDVPCPTIELASNSPPVTMVSPCEEAEATVSLIASDVDGICEYLLDFEFKFPRPVVPRLTIGVGQVTVEIGENACETPLFAVEAIEEFSSSCDENVRNYLLDFNLRLPPPLIPCPQLAAAAAITVDYADPCAEPTVDVQVIQETSVDSCGQSICDFVLDFNFVLPGPPPAKPPVFKMCGTCQLIPPDLLPTLSIEVLRTLGYYECGGAGSESASADSAYDSCGDGEYNYLVDFQLSLPCPAIEASVAVELVSAAEDVGVTVNVVQDGEAGGVCHTLLDFEFRLPAPTVPGTMEYLVKTTSIITARSGTTVGTGTGDAWKISTGSTVVVDTPTGVTIKNPSVKAIPSGVYIVASQDQYGTYWAANDGGLDRCDVFWGTTIPTATPTTNDFVLGIQSGCLVRFALGAC